MMRRAWTYVLGSLSVGACVQTERLPFTYEGDVSADIEVADDTGGNADTSDASDSLPLPETRDADDASPDASDVDDVDTPDSDTLEPVITTEFEDLLTLSSARLQTWNPQTDTGRAKVMFRLQALNAEADAALDEAPQKKWSLVRYDDNDCTTELDSYVLSQQQWWLSAVIEVEAHLASTFWAITEDGARISKCAPLANHAEVTVTLKEAPPLLGEESPESDSRSAYVLAADGTLVREVALAGFSHGVSGRVSMPLGSALAVESNPQFNNTGPTAYVFWDLIPESEITVEENAVAPLEFSLNLVDICSYEFWGPCGRADVSKQSGKAKVSVDIGCAQATSTSQITRFDAVIFRDCPGNRRRLKRISGTWSTNPQETSWSGLDNAWENWNGPSLKIKLKEPQASYDYKIGIMRDTPGWFSREWLGKLKNGVYQFEGLADFAKEQMLGIWATASNWDETKLTHLYVQPNLMPPSVSGSVDVPDLLVDAPPVLLIGPQAMLVSFREADGLPQGLETTWEEHGLTYPARATVTMKGTLAGTAHHLHQSWAPEQGNLPRLGLSHIGQTPLHESWQTKRVYMDIVGFEHFVPYGDLTASMRLNASSEGLSAWGPFHVLRQRLH